MQDFAQKKIIIGICGGIAAYKVAYLVRELIKLGAFVRVVMTDAACEFITPVTMQALSGQDVRTSLFDAAAERAMSHIELARWADYVLIAPATANFLAKMAHGVADDLLSTLYVVTEAPVIVCPAMNRSMWSHQATVSNIQLLLERGVLMVAPDSGAQACGEEGYGRLAPIEDILTVLRLAELGRHLAGKNVVITAGPTREYIDPVRFICNKSSGKMGYALARAAAIAGANVTLVSGPTALLPPPGVQMHLVESAAAMLLAVMGALKPGTIFIGAAAVADYHIHAPAQEKLKKQQNTITHLELHANVDILAQVAATGMAAYVVGFAAETTNVEQYAVAKLHAKKINMIIANKVGEGIGFDSDENQVMIITSDERRALPLMHKTRLAGLIIENIAKNMYITQSD